MKKIILLVCIQIVSLSLFGNSIDEHQSLATNFKKLVDYNKENNKHGNSHLNKYIMVHTPGEEYVPSAVVDYDYIFEHPTGITPEGEYLNNQLVNYNDNTTDDFNFQHYVVVLNLTYVIQSKLNEISGSEVNTPAWYKSFSGDEDVRDLEYYTDQKELLMQHFKDNFSFDVFDSDSDKLISFFIASHENIAATGQSIIAKKKVELISYRASDNTPAFAKKAKEFIKFNKNNFSGESLSIVKSTISNYIQFFYYKDGLTGTHCSDIAARIFYPGARAFFEARCTDVILTNPRKSSALFYSALYLEYLENVYVNVYDSNDILMDYDGIDGMQYFVATLLDEYLESGASEDYKVYLRDEFESIPSGPGFHNFKVGYHRVFYDIEQPSINELGFLISVNVQAIKDNFDKLNVLKSVFPRLEMIWSGVSHSETTPQKVESAWKYLSKNFEYASSGAYSEFEQKFLLNIIKEIDGIEEILYKKWLVGDGGGSIWTNSEDNNNAALHLSNFITRANIAHINSGNENQINIHNVPYKYDDNFAYSEEVFKNLTGDISKTISSDFSNYDYTIPICKDMDWVPLQATIFESSLKKQILVKECVAYYNAEYENVGFFDLVNLITLRNHYAYEQFAYEGDNQESWHTSKPVAGFYLAFDQDRESLDELYANLKLTLQIVGTIFTAGEFALASGAWKIIYGAFTLANMTSFYTINNYQSFEDDLKRWFADSTEAKQWAQSIKLVNERLLLAEGIVGAGVAVNSYANLFTATNYKKAAAFSQMLDDAVDVVDPALLSQYSHLKSFGQSSTGVYLARNFDNVAELDNIYVGLYGINNPARILGESNKGLRELILKARLGGADFKDIHIRLNTLEDAGRLGKFSEDLIANPELVIYFSAATEATILKRIGAWDILQRNGKTLLSKNEDAIGSLVSLLDNSNLASKFPGKTTIEIEDLLGKMKGWGDGNSGATYSQVVNKVNELVDALPSITINFDKYLGSAGFGNGNVYTNRHSWVQLERMLEPTNKSFISSANEIIFENPVSSTFGNSVSDITIFKNGMRIEVETKAGLKFFEGVSGSNFPTQSANSLLNITEVSDYKVFLNPEKIATLNNADKLSVINAWKGSTDDFLGNSQIRQMFTNYWDDVSSIASNDHFENLLTTKSDWFDDIFINNIE